MNRVSERVSRRAHNSESRVQLPDPALIEKRILEKTFFQIRKNVSNHLMEAKVEFLASVLPRWFEIEISGYIWGEEIGRQEVEWPADWWEHFKKRWFPRWAIRKWPVKMITRRFVAKALYPDYKEVFKDQRVVLAMRVDT